ncbi:fasciclin domain-containing protein [Aspergillus alliaceus]|uniref:fasciclin domain-containing protein n=1 Tax=Petromyces alliaceus TaxID=209559 RepID=UPI0012A4968E|nr:FAS1 domain-containing protein [Aspergillus alliaceus]KAB8237276.1 FAS1 domain-containing protein [Aspergillus alliaceus]
MKVPFWLVAVTSSLTTAFVIPNYRQTLHDLEVVDGDINENADFDDIPTAVYDTASDIEETLDDTLSYLDTLHTIADSYFNNPFDDDEECLPEDIADLPHLRPPHHPPSDKTIYELITESKYTTILAKLIKDDEELTHLLNSTNTNHTLFAPTDDAFKQIRHHPDHKPSKELIRAVIKYHLVPGLHDTSSIFHTHTLPTLLQDPSLGTNLPQRLAARVGWRGLTLNFYSHIVAPDIAGTNGLIHAISAPLLPPPSTQTLLDIVPTQFSTFNLGLLKTGLSSFLTTDSKSKGLTVFAPSNTAFQRLGFKINAFLFSPVGEKYLRTLLQYHVVPGRTLYSDVIYTEKGEIKPFGVKGVKHLDLPTLLGDRMVGVDVVRFGPYASLKVNGVQKVGFADALAEDGNVHIVDRVLIPPKRVVDAVEEWEEEDELSVEDLKSRLAEWVKVDEDEDEDEGSELWTHGFEL